MLGFPQLALAEASAGTMQLALAEASAGPMALQSFIFDVFLYVVVFGWFCFFVFFVCVW